MNCIFDLCTSFVKTSDDVPESPSQWLKTTVCVGLMATILYISTRSPDVEVAGRYYNVESEKFNHAFNQAYDAYAENFERKHGFILPEKAKQRMATEAKEGICFGQVSSLFQLVDSKPYTSPFSLAKRVTLCDAISKQFTYRDAYCREERAKKDTLTGDFGIPWDERKISYDERVVAYESEWVSQVSRDLASKKSFMGRVAFDATEDSGHTYAFWKKDGEYGIFDNGLAKKFKSSCAFVKELRDRVIDYRRHVKGGLVDFAPINLCFKD
ncbi:MAG: hypothetical protein MRY21_07315 [Simkaniaceae bacterium]|nr:hypothetical protein [Simkaniaceae bacterium]